MLRLFEIFEKIEIFENFGHRKNIFWRDFNLKFFQAFLHDQIFIFRLTCQTLPYDTVLHTCRTLPYDTTLHTYRTLFYDTTSYMSNTTLQYYIIKSA